MKKSLIKMRVCLGFDCNPRLDVIAYEDDVTDDGRAYQTVSGVRNERTLIGVGQTWVRFDDATRTPHWNAYAIMDAESGADAIAGKAVELQRECTAMMKKGLASATDRLGALKELDEGTARAEIEAKLHGGSSGSAGEIVVKVEQFKKLIADNVKASGRGLADSKGFGTGKWEEFYGRTLTPDILTVLMKGLPVLKLSGDGIVFQTKEMYEQALAAVSGKVTSDVFARFVEEQKSTEKKEDA